MKKQFKIFSKNRAGMTLVELMAAVFVLSIAILATIGVSSTYLKGKNGVRKYQGSSEEVSLVMNLLSKELRMSNCDADSSSCDITSSGSKTAIKVVSNSTGEIVTYSFSGGNLNRQEGTSASEIIANNVSGYFYVTPGSTYSSTTGTADKINRITITLRKTSQPESVFQTTISMRSGYKSET